MATSNLHVIFGFGLLRGNGVGITMTNNIIVINQYFNKLQRPHFLFILTANTVHDGDVAADVRGGAPGSMISYSAKLFGQGQTW